MAYKKCFNALLDNNNDDEVIISQGKQESYDSISIKDNKTIYFTTDENRIFLGDAEYTRPVLHGNELPIKKVASQSLFYNEVEERLYLTLDGISWKSINKQANWQQDDETAVDYIKNKPTVDQTYSSTSENAQSGKAVAESIKDMPTNLVNGSSRGSLRTIEAKSEDEEYTIGECAFAEGYKTKASGSPSHAEGESTNALGKASHAEGKITNAMGEASHSEGYNTKASGKASHAEGNDTEASGDYSHVEGSSNTKASGEVAHAEGVNTQASGNYSHSEGSRTEASGNVSHAEGYDTKALGFVSHTEGRLTNASGKYTHAEGLHTTASSNYQHVQGKYNIEDTENKYADIVGNGDENTGVKSNAYTLDWQGNGWFAGTIKLGGTSQDDANAKEIATKDNIVQSDWTQNDETANDYIKNRIGGYIEWKQVYRGPLDGTFATVNETLNLGKNRDKKYKVIFDDVEYICTVKDSDDYIYLGNLKLLLSVATDETEPFLICDQYDTFQMYASTDAAHSIYIFIEEIVKIPESYLEINNTNLVNGSSTGSLRTTGSFKESTSYTMGDYAFAEGRGTKALAAYQHVQGRYNIEDTEKYADIVGNGTSTMTKSNAYTLDWNGNGWFSGDVYTGSTSGTNRDAGSKKLATENYVDTTITDNKLQFEDTNNDGSVVMYYNV